MTRLNLPNSGAPTQWFVDYSAGTTLYRATGNDQLAANGYNITLVGNGGDDTFIVYAPNDVVTETANSGISTVETWGSGYTLPANVQNLTLEGSADAYAVGNSLDNVITANSGNDRIIAGTGNDILAGGSGNDTFVVSAGDGVDEIQNFHAGDVVALQGLNFSGFTDVQAAMTQSGIDTVLNLGGGQSITFDNTTIGSFNAAEFDLPFHPTGMAMSFDDEFNGLSLNIGGHSGTWNTTYDGGVRTLANNGELEEYMDPAYAGTSNQPLGVNPFTVNNGILTISAQPTDASVAPYINNMPYTSGLLTTEGTFAQTYGYWEVKAQLSSGDGLWPAFWLLPADHSWPPEVDIFEVLGNDTNTVYDTFHGSDGSGASQATHVGNLAVGFHTFGFNWTPSTMTWYVDGLQTYQIATPAYMDKPMYMLIDLAVGGSWAGAPDATTQFPANLKIDYVHVYSLATPPAAPSNLTLDPTTDSGVKGDNITDLTRPEIDGQGIAGDTITVYDGTTAVGTGIVGIDGSWQIVSSALTNGTHILTATQTDAAANTSVASAPLSLTIATPPSPGTLTPHNQSVAYNQSVALSSIFTVTGAAPTQYQVWLNGPTDGSVTDGNGAIATNTSVNETSLTGVNFVGGLAAGGDQVYVRAYDGQWSAWTLATPTDTGAVSANNQSVAYNQSVALSSIFTVSGGGSITGYNIYLASPNDGTVTGGTAVTPGVVVHETSLAGMNYVGSGIPGSDALYLQAVTAQGTGTWTQATLTDPGVAPDVVTAHAQSAAFTQQVALSTLFTVAGNAPTQYDVYLVGPNDGAVTGGNNAVVVNAVTEEDNLTGMNFVGGLAAGGDQVYVRAYDGQWSAWTLATPTDTGAVSANNQSVAYTQSVALSSIFTVSGGGSITGYNIYLASPNDGTVTGGTAVTPGVVVHETSLAGMNYVGSGIPGSDALYLQAVTAQGTGTWTQATLTDPGVAPDVVTAHAQSAAFTQQVALSTLFTVAGNAPTQYDVYLVGPNDGAVTGGNNAVVVNAVTEEDNLTGMNFVGGLAAGGDQVYVRAYDGQWSAWTLATPTDTGAVSANNQSVAYTQSVALSSIFTVSGGGSITGYNIYLASPNDGTVTGGTAVTPGVVVHETSLAGMNYVGSGIPGSDALYLQAVTAQGTGTWTQATLTDPGVAPDVVTAHAQSAAFTQQVALSTLFTVAGNAPTQYDVYLVGPNDGAVTGGNNAVVVNAVTEEDNLTGMNFVGGFAAGGDQVYVRAYDGQWSAWTLATPTDTGAVSANNQSVAYTQSVALSSIFTVSGGGSITGYNIYLASPNDGTVTGGTAVTPGVVVHETSLAGMNYVGGLANGADQLWLQAVTAPGTGNWVEAIITSQSGANDTVSAGSGNNVIYMGGANQTLLDASGAYADTVVGFSEGVGDRIHLTTDTISDALGHSTQVNGGTDTLITLSDSSTILLKGVAHVDGSFFS